MNPIPKTTRQTNAKGTLPDSLPSHAQARGLNPVEEAVKGRTVRSGLEQLNLGLERLVEELIDLRQELTPILRVEPSVDEMLKAPRGQPTSTDGAAIDEIHFALTKIDDAKQVISSIRRRNAL
jgi:hypothetical protein